MQRNQSQFKPWYASHLMKVDAEGVPLVVQSMRYLYASMMFEVILFNGARAAFSTDEVSETVGMMQHHPTDAQMSEAYQNIVRFFDTCIAQGQMLHKIREPQTLTRSPLLLLDYVPLPPDPPATRKVWTI